MNRLTAFAGAILLATVVGATAEASPTIIPVQGTLYDGAGEPINGSRDVTYRVYSSSSATAALWEGTITTTFTQGLFTSYLGQDDPINLVIFRDYSNIWIGVSIAGGAELGRFRVATAPFAGFADYCGEAVQLAADATTAILDDAIDRGDVRYAPLIHRTEWSTIDNIPAGFADGVDNDTTLTEAQVDAFANNNGYLTAASDVAWGRLTGVPAGFADGVDNDTVLTTAQIQAAVRGMAVVPTTDCFLTGYVNSMDQPVNYTCSSGYVLVGQASVHSNSTEDRQFQFRCCRMAIQ